MEDWLLQGILAQAKSKHAKSKCSKPKDKQDDQNEKAQLKLCGEKAVKRKDYRGASNFYSQAIEMDPTDATLYSNRSLCHLQMTEAEAALFDAEFCIQLRPEWIKGYYRKGAALMLLKKHEKACDAFMAGLKLEPGNAEMEKALREAIEAMKKHHAISHVPAPLAKSLSLTSVPPLPLPLPCSFPSKPSLETPNSPTAGIMDPPPPREAFVKSKFASWLIVRMIGKGDPRENELLNAVTEGNARRLKKMVNTMGEKDRAKFTDMNIDGNGLLQVAAHLGKIEVIRYFVEELGFDVNAGCLSDGVTALASAAMFGEAYVVRYLLEHGADPNKTDETGSVALHFAAKNGYEEVVRLLLSSGARTGIVVAHGTPLHIAVFYRRIGVVKILLDHHVDSNNTSGVWGTPILTALRSAKHGLDESDSLECVKLLVKAGADVNYACPNTPLVVATTAGLTDCIKYLLEVHADPNIPDKQSGRTPVEISASVGRRDHVEILFPFTSSISAVTNWTVEGIIAHGKSRRLTPKDESCGKVNDRKAELKSHGEKAVKRNDYLAASKIYSEALELDYFDATLYSNRSLCNLQIGEAQKALLDADRCVELRPKWVKGHYREGAALMVLKEHKKAFEAFLNALKLDPANAEIEKVM
nr:tankyrase-1-like [Oryza sativa Japonica Group]